MSAFLKPMGCLAAIAATAGVAGHGPETNVHEADMGATAKDQRPVLLPRPPIKIPMALDKAGTKVDVTFEIPPLSKGEKFFSSYFVGLRVLSTPGTSDVRIALENHPVSARIFLSRIEDGEEVMLAPFSRVNPEAPHAEDTLAPPENEVIASRYYTQLSGAPPGTPDASTIVLSFGSARAAGIPGVYRLQVETLKDIPELSGITSFLVYEAHPRG